MNSISLSLIPVISRGNVQVNMRNCSQYDRSFGRSSLRSTLLLLYAESIDMMVVQEKEVCGTFLHHALQVSRSSRELERIAETKNLDTQVPILSMPRTELWQCGVGMFVSQYSRLNRVLRLKQELSFNSNNHLFAKYLLTFECHGLIFFLIILILHGR